MFKRQLVSSDAKREEIYRNMDSPQLRGRKYSCLNHEAAEELLRLTPRKMEPWIVD